VLFAFDLDKTLVTDDYELPERSIAAVRSLREAGHRVTVLTGRPMASARRFLEALEIDGPFSVNHGAQVMGPGGRELRRTRLRAADVRLLLDPWRSHPLVEFSCVIDDTLLVKDPLDERWHWAHTESRVVTRFDPALAPDADKVVFASSSTSATIAEHVASQLPHVERYLWGDGFLEVIGAGADKGTALAYIAGLLGVPQHETVAFGDGLNDVSMLRWAGHAVAVGHDVHPDALAEADEHVASPELGGVADWIDRNALGSRSLQPQDVAARIANGA
jgi:5-amino-6-(5-phospho-D-ribitylamino)uracil phosphatase